MNKKIKLLLIFILIVVVIFIFIENKPKYFSGKNESVLLVNEYLDNLTKSLDEKGITYTFKKSSNKKVESLIIKIEKISENNDYIIPSYVSYNVDKNTNEILSKEEIAKYYGYSLDDIINKIDERLKKYYDEEIKLGYVDSNECSFEQYKKFYRNIDDLEEILELYVENNKLYVFIGFDINSLIDDIDYFNNLKYDPFKIEL